jgi:putative long chain acyl-CoA synthase
VDESDLNSAFDRLPAAQRPAYVQFVNAIPVTTWYRPVWRTLQAKGVPEPGRTKDVFKLNQERTHYERVSTGG